jgi:hypothetical protein
MTTTSVRLSNGMPRADVGEDGLLTAFVGRRVRLS